jgi:YtkA-like protein
VEDRNATGHNPGVKIPSLLVLFTCVVAACSSPTPDRPPLKELQRTTAGDLEVVLLATNDALSLGKSQSTIEFQRRSDHHLVDVGAVKATATMPMEGTSPMQGSVFVNRTETPGRYMLDADLGMNGTWHLTVSWDGPAGQGAAAFPGTVR